MDRTEVADRTAESVSSAHGLFWLHPFVSEFTKSSVGLFEAREAHAAENMLCFRELDILVGNDLEAIPPRIVEVESTGRNPLDITFVKPSLDDGRIINNKADVTVGITSGQGLFGFSEGEELIAHVEEERRLGLTAEIELEDRGIEVERSVEIADFERDMVDAHETSTRCIDVSHLM